jgi:hypothetical protein
MGALSLLALSTPTFAAGGRQRPPVGGGQRPPVGDTQRQDQVPSGGQPQLNRAQAAALAGQVCPVLSTGTHNLGRGWKLTVNRCDYAFGPASLDLALSARLKRDNRSLPDFSTTGAIKLRGAIEFRPSLVPPEICLARVQVTGVNFRNVQNDVEQLVRKAVNEAVSHLFCIKPAGGVF